MRHLGPCQWAAGGDGEGRVDAGSAVAVEAGFEGEREVEAGKGVKMRGGSGGGDWPKVKEVAKGGEG